MTIYPPPSLGLDNRKFGMWGFLASEVLFFSVLIANFLVLSKQDPPGTFHGVDMGRELLNIPLTTFNTFVLLTNSFTVVLTLKAIPEGKQFQVRLALFVNGAFGTCFIGVQMFAYYKLIVREGLNLITLF